jgi:hypothetical protein
LHCLQKSELLLLVRGRENKNWKLLITIH